MKKYLITTPEFYTQEQNSFYEKLSAQLKKHRVDFVLFRDKENENYAQLAKTFLAVCHNYKDLKCFIHQDPLLAKKLGATGVHLNAKQFDRIIAAKEMELEVIISTHTHEEVLKAQQFGADYVTYSPIFLSPNKGTPKGIEDLKELVKKVDIKIFALGGIVGEEQIRLVDDANAFGFASIRYFYESV